MGKRAWSPDSVEEAAKLSLSELEQRIAKAQYDLERDGPANLQKLAFKKLVELEEMRETLHGVPAPRRSLRARR